MQVKVNQIVVLAIVWLSCEAARDSDGCDALENSQLKRLCRKVESQEQYFEKMVDIYYKTDRMFHWFSSNKDWLQHARLSRMMKRLLRRATSLNPADVDDERDVKSEDSVAGGDVDAKLQLMSGQLAATELALNQTQQQVLDLQSQKMKAVTKEEMRSLSQQVDGSLGALRGLLDSKTEQTRQELQKLSAGQQQLSTDLNRTHATLQSVRNTKCRCPDASSAPSPASAAGAGAEVDLSAVNEEVDRLKSDLKVDVDQLREKLEMTASDLNKAMAAIQLTNEGALHNFSVSYQDNLKNMMTVFEDRMFENSRQAYDVIVNATIAFGEDLQLIRNSLSNSTSDVQFLIGQDKKSVRAFEDLRSANRRHEGNIQTVTNQLGDFRNQVTDQLNSIRNNFMQSIQEFYNKIVDRQNQMSYRLTSIVDDLMSVKSKVRNLALPASAQKNEDKDHEGEDFIPTLPPDAVL